MIRSSSPFAAAAALLALLPIPEVEAQQLDPTSLAGDWVRVGSTYDPNDQMRIAIAGNTATLTRVPRTVHAAFRVGLQLWQGIAPGGAVRVRGSDGSYYPGTITMHSADSLSVSIDQAAAGNEQVWVRAGPTLDGEWVRIAPEDRAADGIRIAVDGGDGVVRYLPAGAPRSLRIGTRLWRGTGGASGFRAMDANGRYQMATAQFQGADRLWVKVEGESEPQLWVRPAAVGAARATPATGEVAACLASALPYHATDLTWGWQLSMGDGETVTAERIGVLDYRGALPGAGNIVTDIEFTSLPGIEADYSRVWQRASRRISTEEATDLTQEAFDAKMAEHRAAGRRAIDVEARPTLQGTRYAAVWATNLEAIEWSAHRDLTGDAYAALFEERRNAGFRLVDFESYAVMGPTGGGVRHAAIWHRSCAEDNWSANRGLTRAAFQERDAERVGRGFRLVDFESYLTPEGQRYAGIWEEVPDVEWEVRFDQTLPGFLNFHRRYLDLGFRLIDFESYQVDGAARYAGVWAENHPRHRWALRAEVDDSVEAFHARHALPGLSVVILRDGEVLYQRGIGWADSAAEKAAYSGTIYPTASISKAVAGNLAARLEARGVIDLTRPTREFVDSLPASNRHTLEQLLAKTGCVRHYQEMATRPTGQYYRWRWDAIRPMRDSLMLPSCTPGASYHYSTLGFTLLGAALEAATGKDIVTLVTDEVIRPMGLRSMGPLQGLSSASPEAVAPPRYQLAAAYWYDTAQDKRVLTQHEEASWKVLGGGLQVDAIDLARFGWLTLSGGTMSEAVRDDRLWRTLTDGLTRWTDNTVAAVPTALGWVVQTRSGRRVAEHGGSGVGAGTHLIIWRDDGLVIAAMSNQENSLRAPGGHAIDVFAARLGRVVLGAEP